MKAELRDTFEIVDFNFAWNEGREAGQSVAHLHLHVVARAHGDSGVSEYEPRVFLYLP